MPIEIREFISPPLMHAVGTTSDIESPLTRCGGAAASAWQQVIDGTLLLWLRDPELLADADVNPPTGAIIRTALDVAEKLKEDGLAPPDSVVPDPNGGIVFELRSGSIVESIHVWDDGQVEFMKFDRGKLVERTPWRY